MREQSKKQHFFLQLIGKNIVSIKNMGLLCVFGLGKHAPSRSAYIRDWAQLKNATWHQRPNHNEANTSINGRNRKSPLSQCFSLSLHSIRVFWLESKLWASPSLVMHLHTLYLAVKPRLGRFNHSLEFNCDDYYENITVKTVYHCSDRFL